MTETIATEPIDWKAVSKQLTALGLRKYKLNHHDAEEVAQEAVLRCFDSDYADFNPAQYLTYFDYLLATFHACVNARRRRVRHKREVHGVEVESIDQPQTQHERLNHDPVHELTQMHTARIAVEMLVDQARGDPEVRQLLGLMSEGLFKPAELASAMNIPALRVYQARRRLGRHAQRLRHIIEGTHDDFPQA